MTWPAYYPIDCPPEDATDAEGEFYRFVTNDPPEKKDFLSLREMKPGQSFADPSEECQSCGLSLFADWNDVMRARKRFKRLRSRLIARGTIPPGHGVILHTPSKRYKSHHTWWIPEDLTEPWRLFIVDVQTP